MASAFGKDAVCGSRSTIEGHRVSEDGEDTRLEELGTRIIKRGIESLAIVRSDVGMDMDEIGVGTVVS